MTPEPDNKIEEIFFVSRRRVISFSILPVLENPETTDFTVYTPCRTPGPSSLLLEYLFLSFHLLFISLVKKTRIKTLFTNVGLLYLNRYKDNWTGTVYFRKDTKFTNLYNTVASLSTIQKQSKGQVVLTKTDGLSSDFVTDLRVETIERRETKGTL